MSLIERGSFESAVAADALAAARCSARHQGLRQSDISVVIAQTASSRVDVYKSLTITSARDDLVVTHISRSRPGHGMTEPHAKRAAYAACVHLDEFSSYDVWCDDKHNSSLALASGTLHINDMRHSWLADIRTAFQVVNFQIPQWALDDISEDHGSPRVEELHCPMSDAKVDSILKNIALALLPAIIRPDQANRLFVDYAWRAAIAHLARTYGSLRTNSCSGSGGLAPWQERRAKDMLMADLSGGLTLPQLASACRLSCSHFSQAFRQTVGCPPHQWLLAQRVERAKQMILNTTQSLSDIALETGFADQSHFTRVFTQRVRASPAAWRRAQGR
jgi:AraC family transcriptional regulator